MYRSNFSYFGCQAGKFRDACEIWSSDRETYEYYCLPLMTSCSLVQILERLGDSCWRCVWYVLYSKRRQRVSQKRGWSRHVRASQRTVISFLPPWPHLCRFCLKLRWPVSGGNLSLEWFPRFSCTDAAVGVSSLLWCPYSLSSLVLCIRRLEIRPGPDLSHFRWYWSNKRSCDNRFVSQIASFTLCIRPPKSLGVTERAVCSSQRESCNGRAMGTVTLGPEARPSSYSVGTRSLLSGLKRPGRESDLPSPAVASTWRNTPKLVVCFLLGDSPASEFYMPTSRNTVPSS